MRRWTIGLSCFCKIRVWRFHRNHSFKFQCLKLIFRISQIECTIAPLTPTTPEATTFVPPPTIRTCEANDLVSSLNGSAPPLYTSPVGTATTLTVQAYPLEEPLCTQESEIAVSVSLSRRYFCLGRSIADRQLNEYGLW